MRHRLILAIAAIAALALAVPHAGAASKTPTLDGKKTKVLKLVTDAPMQTNDASLAGDDVTGYDRYQCEAPRCAVVPFVYAPAKGVKADIAMSLSWTGMASDFDLYLMQIDKNGRTKLLNCGGFAGTSEKIFVPAGTLKKGKTYAMLVDFYRTPGEKITAEVAMPGKDTTAKNVPENVDEFTNINCVQ